MTAPTIRQLAPDEPRPTGTPFRYPDAQGYVRLRWRVAPFEVVEMREHRYVMEQAIGRHLRPEEHVHHRNENKSDNRIENLEVLSPQEHRQRHGIKHDHAEMERLYLSGMSLPQVANQLGCDSSVVLRGLRSRGVATRSISESLTLDLPLDVIKRLHTAGVSSRRIARELGVSAWAVESRVKALGLPRRRPGAQTKDEREIARRAIETLA